MTPPPLCIGLPVFNGARYVGEAIDSILAQTFSDFELVISDNASTDETEEICRGRADNDPRVRYVRADRNRGLAWNFNHVFTLSESEFFRWAAADDVLRPRCVEACLHALKAEGSPVVLAYPRTVIIDAEGEKVREHHDGLETLAKSPARRLHHVLMHVVFGNPLFGIARREALARTRLHGSYPSADWVLLSELVLVGGFLEVPEHLFLRRDHPQTSRRAYPSTAELSTWIDPAARPESNEHRRLRREFARGIAHAQLTSWNRAACYAAFTAAWAHRHSWLARKSWEIRSARRAGASD